MGRGLWMVVAQQKDISYIYFRGTSDVLGAITDAELFTKRADGRDVAGIRQYDGLRFRGWMHTGFYDTFNDVRESLMKTLAPALADKRPMVFAGHSLGGALALVAAAHAAQNGANVLAVYNSGAPRVGDPELLAHFSEYLKDKVYRLVRGKDIVPHLPPVAASATNFAKAAILMRIVPKVGEDLLRKLNYQHMGQLIPLLSEEALLDYTTNTQNDEAFDGDYWRYIAQKATGVNMFWTTSPMILDHRDGRYSCDILRTANAANWNALLDASASPTPSPSPIPSLSPSPSPIPLP